MAEKWEKVKGAKATSAWIPHRPRTRLLCNPQKMVVRGREGGYEMGWVCTLHPLNAKLDASEFSI